MLPPRRSGPVPLALPRLTDRYRLADDLSVSPFCLGLVSDPRAVPAAFDAGINFFFLTADMHWPLYDAARRGLELLLDRGGGVRDDVVVGVVSYVTQPEFTRMPFVEVLESVRGLGRIDLSIVGGSYTNDLLGRLDAYRAHRDERFCGIRATGASFHDRRAALTAVNHALVDLAFLRYNPPHRGAEADVFPHLRRDGRTLLYNFKSTLGWQDDRAWEALGLDDTYWRPHITDHYRYVLSRPELDGALCALAEPHEVDALVTALEKGPLAEDERAFLTDLADLVEGRAVREEGP